MANRSLEAWKSWKQAQLKYDYYIVGLVAALFAYVGSNYTPQKIAFSQNSLELASILFLAVSLIVGVRRLETDLSIQTITLKQCEAEEMRGAANQIVANGGAHNLDDNGFISVDDAKRRAEQMNSALRVLNRKFSSVSDRSEKLFKSRNWTLMAGFISFAASKVVGVLNL